MISETEIDASFPLAQFLWNGYSTPFRLDRNAHEGGFLFYVWKIFLRNFYLWKKILLKVFVEIEWLRSCSYDAKKLYQIPLSIK